MTIGERIAKMRKTRGLKAVFVAEKVGLSANMLSAIERERCNITVPQLIALADFFGVSTDYLIRGVEYSQVETTRHNIAA